MEIYLFDIMNNMNKTLPLPADVARHVRVISGRVERVLLAAAPGYERAAAERALQDAVLAAHKAEMVVRQLQAILDVRLTSKKKN